MSLFRALSVAAGFFLNACASVPLTSIPSLMKIDFMTTEIGRLRVAVLTPTSLAPKRGGVQLIQTVKLPDEPQREKKHLMVETRLPEDLAGLPASGTVDGTFRVYKFADADVADIQDFRQRMKALKDSGRLKGQSVAVGFGIAATEFCKVGPLPAGALPVTTLVSTSETNGYVTLADRLDLRGDKAMAQGLEKLEFCS